VDRKHLVHFQSETSVFKILWRIVLTGPKVQKYYQPVDVPGQFVNRQSFIRLNEFLVHC